MADGFTCEYRIHKEDYESWNLYDKKDESGDVIYTCSHCGKINVYYVKWLWYSSFHNDLKDGPVYEEAKGKGKWGYIVKKGDTVISHIYDSARDFSNGLASVKKDYKWGLIDKLGKEIVPPRYDFICDYFEGLAWVEINDKWGIIDKAGNEISLPFYDDFGHFSEGLARTKLKKGMRSSTWR